LIEFGRVDREQERGTVEHITRRSFLKLAGCAAVAYAVPSLPEPPPAPADPEVCARLITHLQFVTDKGVPVGPMYEIPPEWFSAAIGGQIISGGLTVDNWTGPTCTIGGIRALGPRGEVMRGDMSWNTGGRVANVCAADTIMVGPLTVTMD
jgi:hypothetical protein